MEKKVKKKRKKLKVKGLIFILLLVYLIGSLIYYLFTLPIKSIEIKNNNLVKEGEILSALQIDENMPLYKVNKNALKENLSSIDLINDIDIIKNINGSLIINIKENKVLFYNVLSKKYVLSNNKEIEGNFIGIPTLVNFIPSEYLEKFILEFSKVEENVIGMISEIEYSPEKYNDTIIDSERYLLRMNDTNRIYINRVNVEKLNRYPEVYEKVGSGGTLYLDSSSNNFIFKNSINEAINEN